MNIFRRRATSKRRPTSRETIMYIILNYSSLKFLIGALEPNAGVSFKWNVILRWGDLEHAPSNGSLQLDLPSNYWNQQAIERRVHLARVST